MCSGNFGARVPIFHYVICGARAIFFHHDLYWALALSSEGFIEEYGCFLSERRGMFLPDLKAAYSSVSFLSTRGGAYLCRCAACIWCTTYKPRLNRCNLFRDCTRYCMHASLHVQMYAYARTYARTNAQAHAPSTRNKHNKCIRTPAHTHARTQADTPARRHACMHAHAQEHAPNTPNTYARTLARTHAHTHACSRMYTNARTHVASTQNTCNH